MRCRLEQHTFEDLRRPWRMIAIDTNILVYAVREDSPWHDAALSCVRGAAEGNALWAIAWPCVHEFLAVITHPKIYKPPTSLEDAILQVDYWMESPTLRLIGEAAGRLGTVVAGHDDETLERAVTHAAAAAESGDVVLLSPAHKSFDMFEDFEDRGRRFKAAVRARHGAAE